jgi:MFS family permease
MKSRFWSAFALSALGYEITFFAMTLVIFSRSRNPFDVGLFTALTLVPNLLAPLFGIVSARIGGRTALSAACGIAGALIAGVGFMRSSLSLFAVWFLISCLFVFISNVRTTRMVDLMGPQGNHKGNSAVLLTLNAARIVAPLLAGAASLTLPSRLFFGLVGLIYLVAMYLAWVSDAATFTAKNEGALHLVDPFLRGAREIVVHPDLSFLAVIVILRQVFLGAQTSLFVVYVKSLLRLGDVDYGYFVAAMAAGSIVGSLLGSRWKRPGQRRLLLAIGLGAHFLSFAALGYVRSLAGAIALMSGSFAVFYATLVSLHSLRDRSTSPDVRSVVYGTITAAGVPAAAVSMLVGSRLIQTMGIRSVLVACGACAMGFLVLCVLLFGRRSSIREGAQVCAIPENSVRKGESDS